MSSDLFFESLYTEELYHVPAKIKIVITHPWANLTKEEKDQLTKIADALRDRISTKLRLEAFEVVDLPSLDLGSWTEKPDKLIYFGPPVKGLNFYEVIAARGTKMVLSETLSLLISSDAAKAKLWLALKQLFAD
jgi:hypothetical protein